MIDSNIDCIISLKGDNGIQQITGKECVCNSFTVERSFNPFKERYIIGKEIVKLPLLKEPTKINIELLCLDDNFSYEFFDKDFKPKRKISQLAVKDCSIQELLFAIRKKIKDKK